MISAKDIDVLRAIARASGHYDEIKRQLASVEWRILEDNVALGYLCALVPDSSDNEGYRLMIGCQDPEHPPYCLLSFFLFADSEERIAAFNSAFHSVADTIEQTLGAPTSTGEHRLSFRPWSYAYNRWSLPEGEFTLVQDEFDIQDGLDITLWIQPVGTPINKTLHL
jgi:hypothetical protein